MKVVKGNVKSVMMRLTQDFNVERFQWESKVHLFSFDLIDSSGHFAKCIVI